MIDRTGTSLGSGRATQPTEKTSVLAQTPEANATGAQAAGPVVVDAFAQGGRGPASRENGPALAALARFGGQQGDPVSGVPSEAELRAQLADLAKLKSAAEGLGVIKEVAGWLTGGATRGAARSRDEFIRNIERQYESLSARGPLSPEARAVLAESISQAMGVTRQVAKLEGEVGELALAGVAGVAVAGVGVVVAAPMLGSGLALTLALTGCGGGATTPGANRPAAAPRSGRPRHLFKPSAGLAEPNALSGVVEGGTPAYTAYNPDNPNTFLKPGMKATFFGQPVDCASNVEGPVMPVSAERLAELSALTGLPVNAVTPALSWTPSGNTDICSPSAKSRSGASTIFVNPDDARGGVGMLTASGEQSDGRTAFFGPWGQGGQNGKGANAGIVGSFVAFRQQWQATDPIQPWLNGGVARIQSRQTVGSLEVGSGSDDTVQAKQQIATTFINVVAAREGKTNQLQYLFNTAIKRANTADWSKVGWFQHGGLWFDPGQGGMAVVDGPVKPSGQSVTDAAGVSLYTSQGDETAHEPFADKTFDVTISFAQLLNSMRAVAAGKLNLSDPAHVTDDHMAQVWGSKWNDRASWVLLSTDVGQEVHNPEPLRQAHIGGGFKSLFVGTQPTP